MTRIASRSLRNRRSRSSHLRTTALILQALEPRVMLAAELVTDLNTTAGSSNPGLPYAGPANATFVDAGGIAYFTATHQDYGTELWRSDGTEAGTTMVKDLTPGTVSSEISNLTNVNGTLFFAAR